MNVIGSRPTGWWRDPRQAVRDFIGELREYVQSTGDDITVVFDVHPPDVEPGRDGRLEVAFASFRGRNAGDEEIVRRLGLESDPASIHVVTSDADLADRAIALRAKVVGAREFRRRMDEAQP